MRKFSLLFFTVALQACATTYTPVAPTPAPTIPSVEVSNVTRHDTGSTAQKSKCDHFVLPASNAVPVITDKQLAAINPGDALAMQKLLIKHVENLHHYSVTLKKKWQDAALQYNKTCSKSQ